MSNESHLRQALINIARHAKDNFGHIATIRDVNLAETGMILNMNRIPENVKTIHMIAVCGTGMGALACLLKDLGFKVTGVGPQGVPAHE